ncbi:Gall11 coactivator domain protein [Purpureocillium lavendulum]|uniref:Gall11 coactivator domain protein n=1 Tax=Purpureocillium lavendulum TaxID=1247861 RepID=A0AB34G4Z9_9HYPO|nr:Gall11 coactivator domain protein [Purpureocillium lavendulum]
MAPQRRRQRHSSVSLAVPPGAGASASASSSSAAANDRPPLAALFLIDFDVKAGYTIVWKRTASEAVELDGRVEYKSLPSGLHTVRDDLIYFVDGAHAGLSAFVNEPCDEEDARNARMIAVGILVPLSYGRLGRAWRHAENLKDMAAKLAKDRNMTEVLEKYWDANKAKEGVDESSANLPPSPTQDRKTHSRNRSSSDGAALHPPEHKLSPFHPAWSLVQLLDRFGPLIFPIHRAALLRRRILISCHAPVHQICDFVYDISILSNIPLSISDSLPASAPSPRLRPLFAIGVHDIPFLMEDFEASKRRADGEIDDDDSEAGSGWIACTTDSILAMKDTLWDMLVTMPPEYSAGAKDKSWPTVECPRGIPIKATQRDLRRYHSLRAGLARVAGSSSAGVPVPDTPESETSAVRLSTSHSHRMLSGEPDEAVDKLAEPPSWAALAYNGYMWWASAGEQLRAEEQEEMSHDAALLADLAPAPLSPMQRRPSSRSDPLTDSVASFAGRRAGPDADEARIELAIIAYFHRLTTQMLSVLVDIVDSAEEAYPARYRDHDDGNNASGEDEAEVLLNNGLGDDDADDAITVDSQCLEGMGLDVWSASDAQYVRDLMAAYFDRPARIEGKGVEVCGVRVC